MPHKLGQVFLKDQNTLHRIVESAGVTSSDHVIEIGCGEGWMSYLLAQKCASLSIFELDKTYFEMTQTRLSSFSNTSLYLGDVLKTDFSAVLSPQFKIVANIPYYISAPIIKLCIQHRHRISAAYLLVQDEFAKKLSARPGDNLYTSLAVHSQYYATTEYLFKVSRNCFRPIPRVDSALIRWTPRLCAPFKVNEDVFFNMVRSVFWGRRKTILRSLSDSPYLELASKFKTDPLLSPFSTRRGETFSLDEFCQLYEIIFPYVLNWGDVFSMRQKSQIPDLT